MRIKLIGDTEIHLPHICDDVGYFVGATNITILQGAEFDPTEGVYATDGHCGQIPYTVSPSEIDTCEVGKHTLTYSTVEFSKKRIVTVIQADAPTITVPQGAIVCDSTLCNASTAPCANEVEVGTTLNTLQGVSAIDAHGHTVEVTCLEGSSITFTEKGTFILHYSAEDECGNVGTAERTIVIVAGSFSGIEDVSIAQGNSFDPRSGVTATKADGTVVPFTVTPSTFDSCSLGIQTFTYTAQGVETATRTVTVTPIANPTISGISQPLSVNVGEEFDPLDGVSAVDGNGNTATVTVAIAPSPRLGIDMRITESWVEEFDNSDWELRWYWEYENTGDVTFTECVVTYSTHPGNRYIVNDVVPGQVEEGNHGVILDDEDFVRGYRTVTMTVVGTDAHGNTVTDSDTQNMPVIMPQ